MIWKINLAFSAGIQLHALLQPDEIFRADKFRNPAMRDRWMLSRAALRLILARHSKLGADAIRFGHGAFGKPSLRTPSGTRSDIQFSLARSSDTCLIAVSASDSIGVDLESITNAATDDDRAMGRAARQFFCSSELAALQECQGAQRRHAFLQIWTRKEACCKAIGTGLQVDLAALDVTHGDDVLVQASIAGRDRTCRLIDLPETDAYVGALAICGEAALPRPQLFFRTFSFSSWARRSSRRHVSTHNQAEGDA